MVLVFLYMGDERFNGKCVEFFLHCTEAKNWQVKEIFMTIMVSFGRNKPEKSLTFPQNIVSIVKVDIKNQNLVKSTSKYCCCKHYGGRSIYLCQKCNVALHSNCFKDYHS